MVIVKDTIRLLILSFIISLSAYFVFAQTSWTEPTTLPPGANRPAPLATDVQGNLTLPGNLTVAGNLELPGSLNVGGNFKFKVGGVEMIPELFNGGEDSYSWTGWIWWQNTDTCDGSVGPTQYICQPNENRSCWSIWDVGTCVPECGLRASETVTCKPNIRWVQPSSGVFRVLPL